MEHISKNVLFVTGCFVTNRSWDPWVKYFEEHGYNAIAPAWPHKEGTPQELRERHFQGNDEPLGRLHLSEVLDHYANYAKNFNEKPIIIGHSAGGLMTQILLNRGFAAAGVAIHPVSPLGVFPYEFSFLRGGWRSLGLFSSAKKTYLMSFPKWQYAFVNGMPLEEQRRAYEENAIPESKTFVRDGLTKAAAVNFDKPHPPLLLTSGSIDHLIPTHLNARNFKRYSQSNGSVTEYKEFPGRNHFVVSLPTWKEDADYILEWLDAHREAAKRHPEVA
ncbi:MAG TPA: alpha/beta hydrolase [Deltaproteobacteria bacterium]|nr:alpha/beta hydrolase [Deltaproteobacteria bacterium]